MMPDHWKKEKDKIRSDTKKNPRDKVHGVNDRAKAKKKSAEFKDCKKPVVVDGAKSTGNVVKGVAGPLAVHDTVCPGWNVEINNVLSKLARVDETILDGRCMFCY